MKNLIMMCAPPGAGKTTYYQKYLSYTRISQDDDGKEGHWTKFLEALKHDEDVFIDRMNFNKDQRERYLKPAREAGYKTKIIVLHVPLRVCLDRCNARQGHPTVKTKEDISKSVNFFFSKYERVEDSETDEVERIYDVPEIDKVEACIFDLDGTMCNIDERLKFVKGKDTDSEKVQKADWKNFFKNIPNDHPNVWCLELAWAMRSSDFEVVFASGRPDDHRKATETWLDKYYRLDFQLFMRARGDYRRDDIVKEMILEFELLPRYRILFVVDDRKTVTTMWRKNGIVCLQCHEGDY